MGNLISKSRSPTLTTSSNLPTPSRIPTSSFPGLSQDRRYQLVLVPRWVPVEEEIIDHRQIHVTQQTENPLADLYKHNPSSTIQNDSSVQEDKTNSHRLLQPLFNSPNRSQHAQNVPDSHYNHANYVHTDPRDNSKKTNFPVENETNIQEHHISRFNGGTKRSADNTNDRPEPKQPRLSCQSPRQSPEKSGGPVNCH